MKTKKNSALSISHFHTMRITKNALVFREPTDTSAHCISWRRSIIIILGVSRVCCVGAQQGLDKPLFQEAKQK